MMNKELEKWKSKLFNDKTTPASFKTLLTDDKKDSIGKLRPWAWWMEITRGCNLSCGFCATRLFPKNEIKFMSMKTWKESIDIISVLSPISRIEFGMAGEPTLNPHLLDMLSYVKKKCPTLQIMLYTNGTTLISKEISYKDMFEAGLNMIYVDMYAPREKHIELAKNSGYRYFEQGDKNAPNIFTYNKDINIHLIQLSEHPGNWSKRKIKSGKISTYFNHLDWNAAAKYGIKPVTKAPHRRCDLPQKFPSICYDGEYSFCCFDFMREKVGQFGNVSDDIDGFFKFWLGKYMQDTRRKLQLKDRAEHEMCRLCAFTSIRCDIPWWPTEYLDSYWDGKKWIKFKTTIADEEIKKKKEIGFGFIV